MTRTCLSIPEIYSWLSSIASERGTLQLDYSKSMPGPLRD
jgi:hypothetical protein